MKKIIIFSIALCFSIQLHAQYSIKVGTSNSGSVEYQPCNNQYEYSWSATVYKQSDINSHGTITDIFYKSQLWGGFGPGANTFMTNQRIFMKLITDNAMTSNAFPDTSQMTLVYAGLVEFLNYQLATIHLDVPFNLDTDHNLMILYINKKGVAETDTDLFLNYPTEHNQTTNNTVYNNANGSFPSASGTYTNNMPVVYLKYSSGLDAGISAINQKDTFMLPQQADLTCRFRNYMADTITSVDIDYQINGIPQITHNWAGTNYCGQESSPIILQNNYAFAPEYYTVKSWTKNPNSGTDELNDNDTIVTTIRIADNKTLAYTTYGDNTVPFLSNRSFGWSASIYNKDYIDFSGQIHAIAYYVVNTQGGLEHHQKIFMRTTPNYTNPSMNYPDTTQFLKVFDGDIDYSSTGWHIITLDTVFDYNNAENLMILYENHAGTATVQATGFKTGWIETNAIYNYNSNTFPTDAGSIATGNRVPAIQLYFSIPKDAGVTNLVNSNVPIFVGDNDFIIDFKNFGSDTLQNVDIKYQIDQSTPISYHWNGTVNPLDEIINLNIGTENLTYGNHPVTLWTENTDYLPDYANENDTLKISLRVCYPLSGTYVIGNAPSDFLSVKAAIDTLNNCGINGEVIFNIKSGTYNSQYILNEVLGASETNTITFQSETGDSTDVVFTTDSTDYLFYLNGTDYIHFNHLTFQGDSATQFIVLDSISNNCKFTANVFQSDTNLASYIYSSPNFDNNNILIQNNFFKNGETGIILNNELEYNSTILITNNIFEYTKNGIYANLCNNLTVFSNIFSVSQGTGININSCDNTKILANKINMQNAEKGIYLNNCFAVTVANNFIYGNSSGIYNAGIYTMGNWANTNSYKIVYNTVNMQSGDCAFYGNNIDSLWIFNNIFIDKTNQVIRLFPNYFESNNNCFYTENSQFGSYNGSGNVSDFNDWITQTQNDSNSVFEFPNFYSDTDLHTNSIIIDNAGTSLPEITDDFDGEPRDALNPDIGADEFTSSCTGALKGTYTIGSSGDYVTFTKAITALFDCGVDSSVTFNIETGTYTEQISIDGNNITYDSIFYQITFQSETGDSTDVILQFDADSLNNYVLKLKNVENFVFKNLTFQAIDTSFGRIIVLDNYADNILFSNNQILGVECAENNNKKSCIYTDNLNNTDTMNIEFNNNLINYGSNGIDFDMGNNNVKLYLFVENNEMINQNNIGINCQKFQSLIVKNNYMDFSHTNYGIKFITLDTSIINQNKIFHNNPAGISAIEILGSCYFIANNFITESGNYGIYTMGEGKIFNNTLVVTENGSNQTRCIRITINGTEIKNNCMVNNAGGKIFDNSASVISDYNNLITSGNFSSSCVTLSDWQNSTGNDLHSISFNPTFVSDFDLHTNSVLLNGKGTPLQQVTDDIDGEPRDATTPDIGADEFDNLVFFAGNDTVFCYYDQYFNENSYVYDIGYGYDTYQWSNGSDSSSILIDTLTANVGDNEYVVTVTTGGDMYSDTINIFYSKPEPISNMEYCAYDSVIIIANQYNYYQWNTGDTTQSIYGFPFYGYTVTVTDNYGCSAKSPTFYVEYNQYPASLPDDTVICESQSIELIANSYTGSDLYSNFDFVWNTGDTTQSIIVNSLTYGMGSHTFYVTVINKESSFNCESIDSATVTIDSCVRINELKNNEFLTIYPNPTKDIFTLQGKNIQSIEITNIYGQIVYVKNPQDFQNLVGLVQIDLSNQAKGTYFIKILTNKGLIVKKLVLE